MSSLPSLDLRKQLLANKVKWGLALTAALVISPVVWMIVQGLVGIAIAGAVGLAIISFAPVVSMKFANWKLKALKSEARENPIETRQNIAGKQRQQLEAHKGAIEIFSAEVKNVETQVKSLRDHGQADDAAEMQRELDKLQKILGLRIQKWRTTKAKLEAFEEMTVRLDRRWKTVQALLRAKKAGGTEQDEAMDRLLAQESAEAVQTEMNAAFAELDMELADSAPAIEYQPANTIDVQAVEIRERVRS